MDERILTNFDKSMFVNKLDLTQKLDKIRPTLGIEIRGIITQTYREIWNMIQRKVKYSSLSLLEVDCFKHHGLEFKKIIIDKCALLINDACIEHLGIDFDSFPNKNAIISSINRTVDTLFAYTVYLLNEELKGNEIENRYTHDPLDLTKDDNDEEKGQRLITYNKMLFAKIDDDEKIVIDGVSLGISISQCKSTLKLTEKYNLTYDLAQRMYDYIGKKHSSEFTEDDWTKLAIKSIIDKDWQKLAIEHLNSKKDVLNKEPINSILKIQKSDSINYKYFYYVLILLLLIALGELPYGYYTFLRIFICITAVYTLLEHKLSSLSFYSWLFIAITYNPIVKIHLEKEDWTPVNIVTALFIGYYLWIINKSQKE